jgi:hypothetical protein
MGRWVLNFRIISVVGLVLGLTGVALVGVASVSAGGAPTLSFTPDVNIGPSQAVLVKAKGFTSHLKGGLSQCNFTPGEPTIIDLQTGQQEPVSCAPFIPIKIAGGGGLNRGAGGYGIESGINGPPDSGIDSAGIDAAIDAANYPCPVLASQAAAGGVCALIIAGTNRKTEPTTSESATDIINYSFESTTTTTTTLPVGCVPAPGSSTNGSAILTVTPATCLVGGEWVLVTGTGFKASSLGTIIECNTTATQPTVFDELAQKNVPVGCSSFTNYLVTTSTVGDIPVTPVTILMGTVGPPATGTDSSGGSATTDAANYPCPPTQAQVAAGVTCTLTFSDEGGDQVNVPIGFDYGS